MATGSLRDLSKALTNSLTASDTTHHPLPESLLEVIQAYLDKHAEFDDHDCQRLHEELMAIHATRIVPQPDKHAIFLAAFRQLMPALQGSERLLTWWDKLVRPTLDSLGQSKAVVADARAIVLNALVYDEDDETSAEKKKAAQLITDRLFEIFLEKTKLLSTDSGAGFAEEERQRFVCSNVEAVLLSFGKRMPQQFLTAIDTYVVQKEYRLQALGLLCSYVRLQGPHLYLIVNTPLFEHLLQCLLIDTSTTVIALALTILIMFMPHISPYLSKHLPKLFVIYTRALCWDKYGVVKLEDVRFPLPVTSDKESQHIRCDSPASSRTDAEGNVWQKLDSSFETAASTTPDASDFFTFLYGLYPINFLNFIREPYKVLEKARYPDVEDLDIDEETIRSRSDQYRSRHTIHPNFLSLTAEKELNDQNRWMKYEAAEITAQCVELVSSHYALRGQAHVPINVDKSVIPDALLPTEDIPVESLLDDISDVEGPDALLGGGNVSGDEDTTRQKPHGSWRDSATTAHDDNTTSYSNGRRPLTGYQSIMTVSSHRDSKTPDSPTIPPFLTPHDEGDKIRDMLALQESLRTGKYEALKRNTPSNTSLSQAGTHSAVEYGSAAASPRLDAYVHTLSKSSVPRSPALRPANSDTQGTIAFLQREVMLLKNDLNFERYLKQQHLSHIGHLQRKHIKESAAEAETQNLINTNKALKQKLEDAKKAYSRVKAEAISSKNHAKKWESELNQKIRSLREEQTVWKAEEEAVRRGLKNAQLECERLKTLLAESETKELASRQKLQSLESQVEELEQLRTFVNHLREKVQDQESKADEYEMQKLNEEAALTQLDRIKMRFQAREQEREKMRRAYEQKLQEMEQKLNDAQKATPPSTTSPAIQVMIDNALVAANARFESLKKSHNMLFSRYTELEMRYLELQAITELEQSNPTRSSSRLYGDSVPLRAGVNTRSEVESSASYHPELSYDRPFSPHREAVYQQQSSESRGHGMADAELAHHRFGPASPTATSEVSLGSYFPSSNYSLSPQNSSHQLQTKFSNLGLGPNPGQGALAQQQQQLQLQNIGSSNASTASAENDTDARSVKTVKSNTSSERKRREAVKATSDVRIRGRGGVQNINKKEKEKKDKESGAESAGGVMGLKKEKRKLKFPTGSGLGGLRGFVQ